MKLGRTTKRAIVTLLALVLVLGTIGCGKGNGSTGGDGVVRTVYSGEMSEWNYMVPSKGDDWANYIDTLVEYDNYGLCQPCLAESWTKSDDGLTWTFKIRKGVEWQKYDGSLYGETLKAEDFVTTIKYILDPANAARTADLLFVFQGAEDYYDALSNGQAADFATVGVKAIDELTLEFTLIDPVPYFLSMLTYNWGYPTNAKYLAEMGEDFGLDNKSILYNGAFLCKEYEPESYRTDYKNDKYWDKDNIYIERIERTYNAEASTLEAEMFLRGEVTSASIPTNQVEEWMNDPEKAKLIRPERGSSYSYFFLFNFWPNFDEKYNPDAWSIAVNNENFRKSFYYALDRVAAMTVYDTYNPENYVLRTITPTNFAAAGGKDFTQLGNLGTIANTDQYQADKALDFKKTAMTELKAQGITFPIKVYMPYNTGSTSQTNLAQVVEQQLERTLGTDYIDIIIDGYPSTDFLNVTRRAGNYAFMMSNWGPDYADPVTYADAFVIGQKYNYIYMADGMATQVGENEGGKKGFDGGYWKDSVYDKMVVEASAEVVDLTKRYTDLANVEAWLIEQAFVIPFGRVGSTGYIASNLNPFESQYAPFGVSGSRYKYQKFYDEPMDSETYFAELEKWTAEREKRIAEAQAAGRDY